MHQYLENQDVILPQEACALHIFRKARARHVLIPLERVIDLRLQVIPERNGGGDTSLVFFESSVSNGEDVYLNR